MDLVTIFRVAFVVGVVAIPILYVLSGRAGERNQDRMRSGNERKERERQSEEQGPTRSG